VHRKSEKFAVLKTTWKTRVTGRQCSNYGGGAYWATLDPVKKLGSTGPGLGP